MIRAVTDITSLPFLICCTARTTANRPSNTKTELGKQLWHKSSIRRKKMWAGKIE